MVIVSFLAGILCWIANTSWLLTYHKSGSRTRHACVEHEQVRLHYKNAPIPDLRGTIHLCLHNTLPWSPLVAVYNVLHAAGYFIRDKLYVRWSCRHVHEHSSPLQDYTTLKWSRCPFLLSAPYTKLCSQTWASKWLAIIQMQLWYIRT